MKKNVWTCDKCNRDFETAAIVLIEMRKYTDENVSHVKKKTIDLCFDCMGFLNNFF